MSKRISRADSIKTLNALWVKDYKYKKYLKSVCVSGESHLRGIRNSLLSFEFPVSVICGPNGAGKTTFMALATLSFHAIKKPLVPLKDIDYFDFNYFFKSTAKDKHMKGIIVGWTYTDSSKSEIVKGEQRWMRYIKNDKKPKRPSRGTEFIGISRIIPAFEKKNYPSYFAKTDSLKEHEHAQELTDYLGLIMAKPYSNVSELRYSNSTGSHSVHNYNKVHTSFNAGAGEECLTHILSTLLSCEEGSFIAIEEIEIGLHPSTLPVLIDVILEVAVKRKLQILITSHSTEFLRSFPNEGLIFAERICGGKVEFCNRPNVEYAIKRIGGEHRSVAYIFCEDEVAGKLISKSLSAKINVMCPVIGFGGKDELIKKAEAISQLPKSTKIIIVWDGDVDEKYITDAKNKGFSACKLPGNDSPESYLSAKLRTKEGREYLKEEFSLDEGQLHSLLNKLELETDSHDIFHTLSQECGVDSKESIVNSTIRFVSKQFAGEFSDLIKIVKGAIEL